MNIAVIGIGGAGGNIACEAEQAGFLSGTVNFSQKDLDAVDVKHKLRLTGSEGVGKNREYAIQLIQDQWEVAARFIQETFSNVDAIIFAFSSSGGSGSGLSPVLIEVICNTMPNKIISAFVVIPDLSEAIVSQMNCLRTFEELSQLNISVFPIDNQKAKEIYVSKNKIFQYTNKKSIDLMKKVSGYTQKHSKNGNFDKKDFLTVLSTPGIASISEVDLVTVGQSISLSSDKVAAKVQESLTNTIFVPTEFEQVTRAAVIFDGQEALAEYVDHESIFRKFKKGMPIDLFEGNYSESHGKLYCILTGLEWCNKRLNDIEISMESNKDKIESVLSNRSTVYQSNTGDLLGKLRKQPEAKSSVMDILSKYKR